MKGRMLLNWRLKSTEVVTVVRKVLFISPKTQKFVQIIKFLNIVFIHESNLQYYYDEYVLINK